MRWLPCHRLDHSINPWSACAPLPPLLERERTIEVPFWGAKQHAPPYTLRALSRYRLYFNRLADINQSGTRSAKED
jgi:hypothetical protein